MTKGLLDSVKTVVVTNTVTNPDALKSLTTGETLEQFIKLNQAYLAASTSAHLKRALGPESGPNKRKRVAEARVRQARRKSHGGAAHSEEPTYNGTVVLRDTHTPDAFGYRANRDPKDFGRTYAPRLKAQLKE